jgi:hypothetical protein
MASSNYVDEECCLNPAAICCGNPATVNQTNPTIDPARLRKLDNDIREAQRQIDRGTLMIELALMERRFSRPRWGWGYR